MGLLLMLLYGPMAYVTAQTFEATVVDARSREPLPFASVYAGKASSTITNSVGVFSVQCDSAEVLRVSYVGYKTQHIACSRLPAVLALEPIEQQIGEVVVLPYPLKKFIRSVTKETLRQLQKYGKRQSQFFYRQTAFSDTTCYELVEAFLTGQPAVSLRNLQLTKGRYAGIRPDSTRSYSFYGNFFTFSQIDLASRKEWPGWNDDIVPLFRNYQRFYDVDYEIIGNAPDRLIALHFEPKPEVKRPIVSGTIYVDEQTLHVRKLEGRGCNVRVLHTDQMLGADSVVRSVKTLYDTSFDFIVNMTEERGFVEVQSVYVAEQHLQDGELQLTRSILFNVGERQGRGREAQLQFGDDLHRRIEQQDYDPEFWRKNETVRRTPMEQAVLQLFEHHRLFGVWQSGE